MELTADRETIDVPGSQNPRYLYILLLPSSIPVPFRWKALRDARRTFRIGRWKPSAFFAII